MRKRTRSKGNVISCPSPQQITLQERLNNVSSIPFILNSIPGLLFSNFRVVRIGRRFLQVIVPGGPGEGNGPTINTLSFNKPLALLFPIPRNQRVRIIARAVLDIQAEPQMSISDLDGLEVDLISIGKDFIEVIASTDDFSTSRILLPLNKFIKVTCFDDDDEE